MQTTAFIFPFLAFPVSSSLLKGYDEPENLLSSIQIFVPQALIRDTTALKMGAFCGEVERLARFHAKKKRGHISAPLKFSDELSPVSAAESANEVGSLDNQSGNDCDEADGNEERLQLLGCFGGHDCSFECPCIKVHP